MEDMEADLVEAEKELAHQSYMREMAEMKAEELTMQLEILTNELIAFRQFVGRETREGSTQTDGPLSDDPQMDSGPDSTDPQTGDSQALRPANTPGISESVSEDQAPEKTVELPTAAVPENVPDVPVQTPLPGMTEGDMDPSGHIMDVDTGMTFDSNSGFYYDPQTNLMYDPPSSSYYIYNEEMDTYYFHSKLTLPWVTTAQNSEPAQVGKRKSKKQRRRQKLLECKERDRLYTEMCKRVKNDVHKASEVVVRKIQAEISFDEENQRYSLKDLGKPFETSVEDEVEEAARESPVFSPMGTDQFGPLPFEVHIHLGKTPKLPADRVNPKPGSTPFEFHVYQRGPQDPSTIQDGAQLDPGGLEVHIHQRSWSCPACDPLAGNRTPQVKEPPPNETKAQKKLRLREQRQLKNLQKLKDKEMRGGSQTANQKPKAAVISPIGDSNKGYQMLVKMGWKVGDSLGPGDHGIKEPISVALRHAQAGLGSCKPINLERAMSNKEGYLLLPLVKKAKKKKNARKVSLGGGAGFSGWRFPRWVQKETLQDPPEGEVASQQDSLVVVMDEMEASDGEEGSRQETDVVVIDDGEDARKEASERVPDREDTVRQETDVVVIDDGEDAKKEASKKMPVREDAGRPEIDVVMIDEVHDAPEQEPNGKDASRRDIEFIVMDEVADAQKDASENGRDETDAGRQDIEFVVLDEVGHTQELAEEVETGNNGDAREMGGLAPQQPRGPQKSSQNLFLSSPPDLSTILQKFQAKESVPLGPADDDKGDPGPATGGRGWWDDRQTPDLNTVLKKFQAKESVPLGPADDDKGDPGPATGGGGWWDVRETPDLNTVLKKFQAKESGPLERADNDKGDPGPATGSRGWWDNRETLFLDRLPLFEAGWDQPLGTSEAPRRRGCRGGQRKRRYKKV